MKKIFKNEVVIRELTRLRNLIDSEDDRNVQVDIDILIDALKKVNGLLTGKKTQVIVNLDMWQECQDSFEEIISEFGLVHNEANSDYSYNKYAITIGSSSNTQSTKNNEIRALAVTLIDEHYEVLSDQLDGKVLKDKELSVYMTIRDLQMKIPKNSQLLPAEINYFSDFLISKIKELANSDKDKLDIISGVEDITKVWNKYCK